MPEKTEKKETRREARAREEALAEVRDVMNAPLGTITSEDLDRVDALAREHARETQARENPMPPITSEHLDRLAAQGLPERGPVVAVTDVAADDAVQGASDATVASRPAASDSAPLP
jgi:hypothetical protein